MVANSTLETLTVAQLRSLAEVRGVEVPEGQVRKADLIELLREAAKQRKADART